MNILLIAIGGALGALCRFLISKYFPSSANRFPLGTFIINIIGSLLLGLLLGCMVNEKWMFFLGTGFCGAFTTFSTLQWEILRFHQERQHSLLLLYLTLSYTLGILSSIMGFFIGKFMCS
ncbi:fluoride efflux transporter CrcB [Shimazuella sp. AN120528]|uniref:fluoride efflux transporter CrcB n=1 Tax=Shimazuella soli TaxID=1892854 RepID=UPI001F0E0FEA|nr:fluoride efflux transporter CrcB [Shimazuella soli]MCH5585016.1 fluoride efflux transporter CrcB [Shimazuella soli]